MSPQEVEQMLERLESVIRGLERSAQQTWLPPDTRETAAMAAGMVREAIGHRKAPPKTCSDCNHMGPFGHGEPPTCEHPARGDRGPYGSFCNPRGEPPQWCPLRQLSRLRS